MDSKSPHTFFPSSRPLSRFPPLKLPSAPHRLKRAGSALVSGKVQAKKKDKDHKAMRCSFGGIFGSFVVSLPKLNRVPNRIRGKRWNHQTKSLHLHKSKKPNQKNTPENPASYIFQLFHILSRQPFTVSPRFVPFRLGVSFCNQPLKSLALGLGGEAPGEIRSTWRRFNRSRKDKLDRKITSQKKNWKNEKKET